MWSLKRHSKDCKINIILKQKRVFFILLFIFGFFLVNIFVISHYLDLQSHFAKVVYHRVDTFVTTASLTTLSQTPLRLTKNNCFPSNDSLSLSAFRRMKTEKCRTQMNVFLCSIDKNSGWPITELKNKCAKIFDPSNVQIYKGCFKDTPENHLLKDFKYNLKSTNSPEICVQACLRAGFQFAGLEYRWECFCGNRLEIDIEKRRLDDKQCQTFLCPNTTTNSFCGGFQALAVYSTGFKKIIKPIPVFFELPSSQTPESKNIANHKWDSTVLRPKILFLLQLNGRNSQQVRRLIKLIYRPNHLYFIHVDERQNYMFLEMLQVEKTFLNMNVTNFKVAKERFSTIWGGSSLLNMFLKTIRSTLESDSLDWSSWDYILNLSETDMPLLSLDELEYNLLSNIGMSFLSSHGYNTGSFIQKQGFNFYFMECEKRMWRISHRKNYPKNLLIDGGSDWVIVHRDLAKFSISKSHQIVVQLEKFFSTILLPLESFFHSLAINSQFCEKILYRNLRLTNWRRKQGCRCSWLKKIVDWCGCSPLAIRHYENKFDIKKLKAKVHFFGRKFDSFVDAKAITLAERQCLRFHSKDFVKEREKTPSFNSTWINFYRADVDGKNNLFDQWANSLAANPLLKVCYKVLICKTPSCFSTSLNEIFAFKILTTSSAQFNTNKPKIGVVTNLSCEFVPNGSLQFEMLIKRKNLNFKIFEKNSLIVEKESNRKFKLLLIEYGVGLDLKEEVFRGFPAIVSLNDTVTILWHWREIFTQGIDDNKDGLSTVKPSNFTSPQISIEFWIRENDESSKLVHSEEIKPYDSINFLQFFQLDLKTLKNAKSGIWTAKLFSQQNLQIAVIQFPVFPSRTSKAIKSEDTSPQSFKSIVDRFYLVIDYCIHQVDESFTNSTLAWKGDIKLCRKTYWSTRFPDPKSRIQFGFNNNLAILD